MINFKKSGDITEIWRKYELGKNHHNEQNLYEETARAWRFYEGDQWYGLNIGGISNLPVLNFITTLVNYKFISVAMQNIRIVYNLHDSENPQAEIICRVLNKYAMRKWESQKLDSKLWKAVLGACVAGDEYLYFYNKNLDCQLIDNTSIYFADEQQEDIQKQNYIIIQERRPVADIRREAKKNGLQKSQISMITGDNQTDTIVGDRTEVDRSGEGGKCISLLYLTKNEDGDIIFCRSTRNVIYEPMKTIKGLKLYPIAAFVWNPRKNSCRGLGEVRPQIPNQIATNQLLARRHISAQQNAFAKPVYVENQIDNPSDIDKIGKAIRLRGGNVQKLRDVFDYITPAPMSPEAGILQQYVLETTRNLSGSGDAAVGNVNPEHAAASAIIAIQNQANIPMNKQMSAYKQFIEDIALVWLDMWKCYQNELKTAVPVSITDETGRMKTVLEVAKIHGGDLDRAAFDIKIDATPTSPYSIYAEEQFLSALLNTGQLKLDEFIEALPENGTIPKNRLKQILGKRLAQPEPPEKQSFGTHTPMAEGAAQPTNMMSRPVMG